jgi:CysZ protein
MITAAIKALSQMMSPAFRAVLLKSIGLALVLIIVLSIGLHRLLAWLAASGGFWLEELLGSAAQTPLNVFLWIVTIAAGFGIVLGAIFLMPAVTALVASFFVDDIAGEVERTHYPGEPGGRPVPATRAFVEGAKTAALAANISSSRPCAFAHRQKQKRCAGGTPPWCSAPACSLRYLCRSRSSTWPRRYSARP